jgi:hypothetical protein
MQTQTTTTYTAPSAADPLRDNILAALWSWIAQRPGLEPRNYIRSWDDHDGRAAYRSDSRAITQQFKDAAAMLRYVELRPSVAGGELQAALCNRLTYTPGRGLDYTTGQYWPMEYRAAVCRALASVLWDRFRADIGEHATGDAIRQAARRELGRSIAGRWFR